MHTRISSAVVFVPGGQFPGVENARRLAKLGPQSWSQFTPLDLGITTSLLNTYNYTKAL